MAAVTICHDFGTPKNKVCHCFHCFPIYLPWNDGLDVMIFVFWMLSFKPGFPLFSFTFIKRLFSSSSLSAIRVVSYAYLRLYDQPRQCIKKQRYCFNDKGPTSQSYDFSSSHVWMWELNYKKSLVLNNWCFWPMVLEKTLESPLVCKEMQQVNAKGN